MTLKLMLLDPDVSSEIDTIIKLKYDLKFLLEDFVGFSYEDTNY